MEKWKQNEIFKEFKKISQLDSSFNKEIKFDKTFKFKISKPITNLQWTDSYFDETNNFKKDDTELTLRYYGIGAQIIKDFKVKNMILFSRTKKKIIGLEGFGLKIKKQIIIKWKF